jgi:hypothetical protein
MNSGTELQREHTCCPSFLLNCAKITSYSTPYMQLLCQHLYHAGHIEKIKSRYYVGVQADGKFVPGELGMGLGTVCHLKTQTHLIVSLD